ncbi:CB1 cannabinoid receptor-interacting protein 1-like [Oncorhynchus nerka]|uniref:CB1 cannabinoid receptor-interacting protein 1-like n=1 Tax=Oncorhynchus nerka TaxID=8023 RepID=UPI001130A371|nr:CB1 cannabinoid receptor-interacting protein 1-like [Oncorhynchus nerka]
MVIILSVELCGRDAAIIVSDFTLFASCTRHSILSGAFGNAPSLHHSAFSIIIIGGPETIKGYVSIMVDDVPPIINIAIALKIQPNDGPVFFKVDGTRFGQSRTIKLLTGSKYKVEVVMKPANADATTMNIGGITIPLEQQSKDEESVVYHGQYDTEGVPHTKSGDRQPVQVSIEFGKAGQFETIWQVKYYNYYKRDQCQFGNKFTNIEYECKPNETRSLMWINKEVFN